MSIRKLALAAILSASLSSAPVMAQTAPAPVTMDRASVQLEDADAQAGGFPFLIVFVVIAGVVGAVLALDKKNNNPVSV